MISDISSSLDALFSPSSVAVVGASNDWRRFGGRVLHYLKQSGFAGPLYPVNPGRSEVQGIEAYASVQAIGRPFDCALLSITAEDTVDTLRACARAGVKSAVVYGGGFAEIDAAGKARQNEIAAIARASGMRVLGPNCMGLVSARSRFHATFANALEGGLPPAGRIAMATQSGGYGGYMLQHALMRNLGLSHFATTGNECDIEFGEVLHWMARQDDVDVLLGYIEGVRSRDSLLAALETARRGRKPVVMMKVGRTAEGRIAAASHTASLTGEDSVYDAVFREYGVYRAHTTDEMLDVVYALSRGQRPQGKRTAVISMSGGIGVQMADFIGDAGLELAPVPEQTQTQLRAMVPYCSPVNPIDMTGVVTANHGMLGDTLNRVLESRAFDAVVVFLGIVGMAASMAEPISSALREAAGRHPDSMLLLSVTTPPELRQVYDNAGFLVYEDPSRAITALAALLHFEEVFGRQHEAAGEAPRLAAGLLPTRGEPLNEVQAKRLMAACGIPSPQEQMVPAADAAEAAARIGFPVAVKVVSADIPHKTEHGGVALGLSSAAEVQSAVRGMAERIARELPDARIDGYLVSEMVSGGTECIVGVHQDATFGPVVSVGIGGVAVELLRDVAIRLAPVSPVTAMAMLRELRTWPLLAGYRGAPAGDVEAFARAISALSHVAAAHPGTIAELEVNPVVIRPAGRGIAALDAVVRPAPPVGRGAQEEAVRA